MSSALTLSARARAPFALVTISHWYGDKARSAASSGVNDSSGRSRSREYQEPQRRECGADRRTPPACCRAPVTRIVRPARGSDRNSRVAPWDHGAATGLSAPGAGPADASSR